MDRYTLVVVDMQKMFPASLNALSGCTNAVELFVKTKNDVIFVEFVSCGQTHSSLKKMCATAHYVSKTKCDGSKEIIECVTKNGLSTKLVICGVNTGACVFETARGLIKYAQPLYVLEPGCASSDTYSVNDLVKDVKRTKKLDILNLRKLLNVTDRYNFQEACL